MNQQNPDIIDLLLEKAKNSGNNEDLSQLWKATLHLPQWHFITRQTDRPEDRKPFIGVIESRPWVFMFTDREKAREYGNAIKDGGFVDEEGNVLVISMDTQKAVDYLMSLSSNGVYGIRINELNGWFSPLAQLPAIIRYVK